MQNGQNGHYQQPNANQQVGLYNHNPDPGVQAQLEVAAQWRRHLQQNLAALEGYEEGLQARNVGFQAAFNNVALDAPRQPGPDRFLANIRSGMIPAPQIGFAPPPEPNNLALQAYPTPAQQQMVNYGYPQYQQPQYQYPQQQPARTRLADLSEDDRHQLMLDGLKALEQVARQQNGNQAGRVERDPVNVGMVMNGNGAGYGTRVQGGAGGGFVNGYGNDSAPSGSGSGNGNFGNGNGAGKQNQSQNQNQNQSQSQSQSQNPQDQPARGTVYPTRSNTQRNGTQFTPSVLIANPNGCAQAPAAGHYGARPPAPGQTYPCVIDNQMAARGGNGATGHVGGGGSRDMGNFSGSEGEAMRRGESGQTANAQAGSSMIGRNNQQPYAIGSTTILQLPANGYRDAPVPQVKAPQVNGGQPATRSGQTGGFSSGGRISPQSQWSDTGIAGQGLAVETRGVGNQPRQQQDIRIAATGSHPIEAPVLNGATQPIVQSVQARPMLATTSLRPQGQPSIWTGGNTSLNLDHLPPATPILTPPTAINPALLGSTGILPSSSSIARIYGPSLQQVNAPSDSFGNINTGGFARYASPPPVSGPRIEVLNSPAQSEKTPTRESVPPSVNDLAQFGDSINGLASSSQPQGVGSLVAREKTAAEIQEEARKEAEELEEAQAAVSAAFDLTEATLSAAVKPTSAAPSPAPAPPQTPAGLLQEVLFWREMSQSAKLPPTPKGVIPPKEVFKSNDEVVGYFKYRVSELVKRVRERRRPDGRSDFSVASPEEMGFLRHIFQRSSKGKVIVPGMTHLVPASHTSMAASAPNPVPQAPAVPANDTPALEVQRSSTRKGKERAVDSPAASPAPPPAAAAEPAATDLVQAFGLEVNPDASKRREERKRRKELAALQASQANDETVSPIPAPVAEVDQAMEEAAAIDEAGPSEVSAPVDPNARQTRQSKTISPRGQKRPRSPSPPIPIQLPFLPLVSAAVATGSASTSRAASPRPILAIRRHIPRDRCYVEVPSRPKRAKTVVFREPSEDPLQVAIEQRRRLVYSEKNVPIKRFDAPTGLEELEQGTLGKRLTFRPCLWEGCGAVLGSEWALGRHVEVRRHAEKAMLEKLDHTEPDFYQCLWASCAEVYYPDVKSLKLHIRAKHTADQLSCPYESCNRRCFRVSILEDHITRRHKPSNPPDVLRLPFDRPYHPPPIENLPALPTRANPYQIQDSEVLPGRWKTVESRKSVIDSVSDLCWSTRAGQFVTLAERTDVNDDDEAALMIPRTPVKAAVDSEDGEGSGGGVGDGQAEEGNAEAGGSTAVVLEVGTPRAKATFNGKAIRKKIKVPKGERKPSRSPQPEERTDSPTFDVVIPVRRKFRRAGGEE